MMLIVADSHVAAGGESEAAFFAMLDAISQTPYDVLFLGDNLDIWIASAPRYESDEHTRFLAWCRREKQRRRVILVEGNHEFYVCRHHADAFTACTETVFRENGVSFVHGDMTQAAFGFHRVFRAVSKNRFGDFIMRWLPWGVPFSRWMKRILAHDARHVKVPNTRRDLIPFGQVTAWAARECRTSGSSCVVMGHFHQGAERDIDGGSARCIIIPAWKNNQEIAFLELAAPSADARITIGGWRQLLDAHENSPEHSDKT